MWKTNMRNETTNNANKDFDFIVLVSSSTKIAHHIQCRVDQLKFLKILEWSLR